MHKSILKLTVLTSLTGPLGLCYISVNAGLVLTLGTLFSILLFKDIGLYLLLGSFPIAASVGAVLVHIHNRKAAIREFSLSTYIGRVSCKVVSSDPVKRDYHKSLTRARLKNNFSTYLHTALGVLCIIVTGFIAAPDLIRQFAQKTQESRAKNTNISELSRNDTALPPKLPDTGHWFEDSIDNGAITIWLKANEYQNDTSIAYRPRLILSCIANKTTLRFESGEILDTEKVKIKFSFNSNTLQNSWATTADYQSAMAPNPIQIAKQLSANTSVGVHFGTFSSKQQKNASFDLRGSKVAVSKIRKRCSW